MANMSYCRFQNTLADLKDCESSMGDDDLSYDEYCARRRLVKLCIRIAKDYEYEILDNDLLTRKEYEKIHNDDDADND